MKVLAKLNLSREECVVFVGRIGRVRNKGMLLACVQRHLNDRSSARARVPRDARCGNRRTPAYPSSMADVFLDSSSHKKIPFGFRSTNERYSVCACRACDGSDFFTSRLPSLHLQTAFHKAHRFHSFYHTNLLVPTISIKGQDSDWYFEPGRQAYLLKVE